MKIESVDMFYLAMPSIRDIGDGSQDALLVRVRGGGLEGWGECEASPLVSIANFCCPMSHSACKGPKDIVLGAKLDSPDDILQLGQRVREQGLDIAQTDHTFSGIEIALWDLLGKQLGEPVYHLLGYERAFPKIPYASSLFGETAEETFSKARAVRQSGFIAAKFGWGPYGRTTVDSDAAHLAAAREGLGSDARLLVDAGTVWGDTVSAAADRIPALHSNHATWLEEPFVSGALEAYATLASQSGEVKLAAGEGAHDFYMATQLIDHGRVGYIQIDTGRIGGIGPAKKVADYASARGVQYVNHTFTTHLALSASLQPFVGLAGCELCEYPVEASPLARELNHDELKPGGDGMVRVLESPGLGVTPRLSAIQKYLVEVEIKVGRRTLYETPKV